MKTRDEIATMLRYDGKLYERLGYESHSQAQILALCKQYVSALIVGSGDNDNNNATNSTVLDCTIV